MRRSSLRALGQFSGLEGAAGVLLVVGFLGLLLLVAFGAVATALISPIIAWLSMREAREIEGPRNGRFEYTPYERRQMLRLAKGGDETNLIGLADGGDLNREFEYEEVRDAPRMRMLEWTEEMAQAVGATACAVVSIAALGGLYVWQALATGSRLAALKHIFAGGLFVDSFYAGAAALAAALAAYWIAREGLRERYRDAVECD